MADNRDSGGKIEAESLAQAEPDEVKAKVAVPPPPPALNRPSLTNGGPTLPKPRASHTGPVPPPPPLPLSSAKRSAESVEAKASLPPPTAPSKMAPSKIAPPAARPPVPHRASTASTASAAPPVPQNTSHSSPLALDPSAAQRPSAAPPPRPSAAPPPPRPSAAPPPPRPAGVPAPSALEPIPEPRAEMLSDIELLAEPADEPVLSSVGTALTDAPPPPPPPAMEKVRKEPRRALPLAAAPPTAPSAEAGRATQRPISNRAVEIRLDVALKSDVPPVLVKDIFEEESTLLSAVDIAKNWSEWLETASKNSKDSDRTARLQFELGLSALIQCEYNLALRHLEACLEKWPEQVTALRAARIAARQLKRWNLVYSFLERELKLSATQQDRAVLLAERARYLQESAKRSKEARDDIDAAVQSDSKLAWLSRASAILSEVQGDFSAALNGWKNYGELLSTDLEEQSTILAIQGRLQDQFLNQRDGAIEAYRSAVSLNPATPGAQSYLRWLWSAEKRWADLADFEEVMADLADDPGAAAECLVRAARIRHRFLNELSGAKNLFERAASLSELSRSDQEELVQCYRALSEWPQLVELQSRLLGRFNGSAAEWLNLGQICIDHWKRDDQAIACFEEALGVDNKLVEALDRLAQIYRRQGDYRGLVKSLERCEAILEDESLRAEYLAEIAQIWERHLGNPQNATAANIRALAIVPNHPRAFRALERIYGSAANGAALAELYERAFAADDQSEYRTSFGFALARLYDEVLEQPKRASQFYESLGLVSRDPLDALHAAQRAAERSLDFERCADLLLREGDLPAAKTRRLALLQRAAEMLFDECHHVGRASLIFQKILQEDPQYRPALKSYSKVLYRSAQWEELCKILELEVKALGTSPSRADIWAIIAEIQSSRLANNNSAREALRKALLISPQDSNTRRELVRLASEAGDHGEVARILEQSLESAENDIEKLRISLALGALFEGALKQPQKAIKIYEGIIELFPGQREAAHVLPRLYYAANDQSALSQFLIKSKAWPASPRERAENAFLLAETLRDSEWRESKKAASAFDKVIPELLGLLESPGFAKASALAVIRLLEAKEDRIGLVAALSESATQEHCAPSQMATIYRLAQLLEEDDKQSDALTKYRQILSIDSKQSLVQRAVFETALHTENYSELAKCSAELAKSDNEPLCSAVYLGIESLCVEAVEPKRALELCREAMALDPALALVARSQSRLAYKLQDIEGIREGAKAEARLLNDSERAASLLMSTATRQEKQGEFNRAIELLDLALELHPDHENSALLLEQLLSRLGGFEQLRDILSRTSAMAENKARKADLCVRLARIYADCLDDGGAAIHAAQRSLAENPDYPQALLILGELLARGRQWSPAVEKLARLRSGKGAEELKRSGALLEASLYADQLKDPKKALGLAEPLIDVAIHRRDALAVCVRSKIALSELSDAAKYAQDLVGASSSAEEKAFANTTLAEIHRKNKQASPAWQAYASAIELVGTHSEAFQESLRWAAELQTKGQVAPWDRLASALKSFISSTHSVDDKVQALLELAKITGEKLSDRMKAVELLREAVSYVGEVPELMAASAEHLVAANRLAEAVSEYGLLLKKHPRAVEYWRRSQELLSTLGKTEGVRGCIAPIIALGQATDLERATYGMRAAQIAATRQPLVENLYTHLEEQYQQNTAIRALLAAVSGSLHKIFATNLDHYGVSSRDRMTSKTAHPVRQLAQRVAQCLGLNEFDLYLHNGSIAGVQVEFTEGPALMMHESVTQLTEAQQVFLLARVLSSVSRGVHAVHRLQSQSLGLLLAATIKAVDGNYSGIELDASQVSEQAKMIYRAISRKERKQLEELLQQLGKVDLSRVTQVRTELLLAAHRAAAIICDHPVEVFALSQSGSFGEDVAQDLPGFVASEKASMLRRSLGII